VTFADDNVVEFSFLHRMWIKVEFIVMGGTFMSLPASYRDTFVAQLHNSLSGFTGTDLDEAVKYSELARTKCIGITIETRPDYCLEPHLTSMLRYGCTRLEVSPSSPIQPYSFPAHHLSRTCPRSVSSQSMRTWPEIPTAVIQSAPRVNRFKRPKMLASRWFLT
jgi:hypothetical protein